MNKSAGRALKEVKMKIKPHIIEMKTILSTGNRRIESAYVTASYMENMLVKSKNNEMGKRERKIYKWKRKYSNIIFKIIFL